MSVGFAILVHEALDRASQVARHWARQGCPIVIHVDQRVTRAAYDAFVAEFTEFPDVRFCRRLRCEWGTWSIVEATIEAASDLLKTFPQVQHVYLASGACLPLRPVSELETFLSSHPDTDFIESVTTDDVSWTVGGLDRERFTLSFPFSWKQQRVRFDAWVRIQRMLGHTRKSPPGLTPHLGSQWWCLTRRTFEALLADPERERYVRYFRHVWIPDESYFQTVVRYYARKLESRSLTLSKFDFQGKPHIFYDDHLQMLQRSDCFVARKIWPRADRLYRNFLGPASLAPNTAPPNPGRIDRIFAKAVERRTRGRAGLYMQSRYPNWDWENGKTAAPYSVFEGFADLYENFADWLSAETGARVHGHLYAPERVEFADGQTVFAGALSDSAKLRDYNPVAFLTNLTWSTRGERQSFSFGPRDNQDVTWFLAADPNAHFAIISGAWIVPMFHSGRPVSEIRKQAAIYQATEAAHLEQLRATRTRARVRVWTLADFLETPGEFLNLVFEDIGMRGALPVRSMPKMVDLRGFSEFLQELRNQGMHPHLMGNFPFGQPDPGVPQERPFPTLVK